MTAGRFGKVVCFHVHRTPGARDQRDTFNPSSRDTGFGSSGRDGGFGSSARDTSFGSASSRDGGYGSSARESGFGSETGAKSQTGGRDMRNPGM